MANGLKVYLLEKNFTYINAKSYCYKSLVSFLFLNFLDSDKCYHLPPPPKKRKGQKRTQSFMIPFIDVLNSIPEIPENKQ